MKIVRTKEESLHQQFVGLQAECPDCQYIIEIERHEDVITTIPGNMFQRRGAVATCPNCGKEVTFREGVTAWFDGDDDRDVEDDD